MKRAIITCNLDGYANSIKPFELKKFLEGHGFDVRLYSTIYLSRLGEKGIKRFLPYPTKRHVLLYVLEFFHWFASKQRSIILRKKINSAVLISIIKRRGEILAKNLSSMIPDLLICESNFDEAVVLHRVGKVQLLDLPSPFAEEQLYGDEIDEKCYRELRSLEKTLYKNADYISFHWYKYSNFVKKYKYKGNNFIDLGYGTNSKEYMASYSSTPRIIYLGYLGGYWNNVPLLEKLSEIYPYIDVYGGPKIPGLKINYKGRASTLEILKNYQFGLVTITDDPLRREGFSSKQLEYFSYALPVFVPEWRKDKLLEKGTIYYNLDSFVSLIREYSNDKKWKEKSLSALQISQELSWNKVLKPLLTITDKI